MIERCNNPKCDAYPRYGGRGIMVCLAWHHFENFLRDMGEKPSGRSIDRIDNDAGYRWDNCRWATPREQQLNRRTSYKLQDADGNRVSIVDAAKALGISVYGLERLVKPLRDMKWL